jgi:ABC-type antimicrobial peptide transport system permease subunit
LEFKDEPARQVIGIVSDVRGGFAQTPYPSIYLPITAERFRFMMYVARVAPGGAPAVPELRARLRQIGADPASPSTTEIAKRLSGSLVDQEFRTALFGAFGVVALLLAAVGLYAVASFDVSQRRREMGVRLTLGAAPRDIQRQVVIEALRPVAVGVGVGLLAAWWAGQFLQSFLHDVDARDPWTLCLVAAALLVTAAAAAWLPARRAARTDPAVVLRAQ